MARKIHQLKNHEENFALLAVACHEPDYRASWILNQSLATNFIRVDDLKITDLKTNADLSFSRYFFDDENRMMQWYLISNHTENAFLAPELKNVDFFLRLSGEINPETVSDLLPLLKKTNGILTAFEADQKKIKNIAYFLF